MTTQAQQLKKELTKAFPELKFSVKTEKKRDYSSRFAFIYFIRVTVTGLIGSPYTKNQVEKIANKYENRAASTYVAIRNLDGDSLYEEIMKMVPDYESNWPTVHKVADNDYFTVLPDGYYEEKMSSQTQEVIDSAVTERTEKETIDTSDKWFDEWFSGETVGELAKGIESSMKWILNNCFGETFHSGISVNRLGNLLVATIDGVEYHVPSLLYALCNYTNEDFDNGGYYDLPDYLRDCEYSSEANNSPYNELKTSDELSFSEKRQVELVDWLLSEPASVHEVSSLDDCSTLSELAEELEKRNEILEKKNQELEQWVNNLNQRVHDLECAVYLLQQENKQLKSNQTEPEPQTKPEPEPQTKPEPKPTAKKQPKFKLPENFADYQQECDDLVNGLSCFYNIKKGKWGKGILQFILTPTDTQKEHQLYPYPDKWKAGLYLQPGQWTIDKVNISDPDEWEEWFMDINDFADANDIEIS